MKSPPLVLADLQFSRCQYRLRQPGWTYPPAYHRDLWEIYVCWQGQFEVGQRGRATVITARQALVIPPGRAHDARVLGEDPALIGIILFRARCPRLRRRAFAALPLAGRRLDRLRQFMNERGHDATAAQRRLALLTLFLLDLAEPAAPPTTPHAHRLQMLAPYAQDPLVERVLEHLLERLPDGLALEELETRTGYGASRLRQLFRQRTGMSLRDAMMQLRLEEAQRLLLFSGLKIAAVAHMVGFRQTPKFNQFFRRCCGCSPTQFQRSGVRFGEKWGEEADHNEVQLPAGALRRPRR